MRCNECRRRHRRRTGKDAFTCYTLKRHPLAYKRESSTKCPVCGSLDVVSIEHIRKRDLAKRKERGDHCQCNAYPFPHQKGSMRMCDHHPKILADEEVTEEEARDYQACLETPRSGWG